MMENENFDEELKNRIKQVFEEYDDSTANEGWNLLREKYPEKNHRNYFFWWLGSAAALLLIGGIFWFSQPETNKNQVTKAIKQQTSDSVAAEPNRYSSAQKSNSNLNTTDSINTQKTSIKTASGAADKSLTAKNKSSHHYFSADTIDPEKTPLKTASGFIAQNAGKINNATTINSSADSIHSKKTPVKTAEIVALNQKFFLSKPATLANSKPELQPKPATEKTNDAVFTGIKKASDGAIKQSEVSVLAKIDSSKQKKLEAKTPVTSIAKIPETKKVAKAESNKKSTEKPSAFSLGLYAGPHVNYGKGSNSQLGLGAGLSTDFRLGKQLKFSTGLALMQNKLAYGQNTSHGSLDAANSNYSASLPPTSVLIQAPVLSNMDANFVTLDVPLNLTYSFLPGKNSIAISAGISSNTFVKEDYGYSYSNSASTTQNIKAFNSFNFAKTLNISAGFAYPLGKNKVQVEPFLKYPLGRSGSQQLLFGSAGINLKMNFSTVKK